MALSEACLILTDEAVMAQDIALTLSDRYGPVPVIIARTPAEALSQLAPVDRLLVAIADLSPADYAGSPLANAVSSRSGKVILLTDVTKVQPAGSTPWTLLDRPFQSHALVDLLPQPPGR